MRSAGLIMSNVRSSIRIAERAAALHQALRSQIWNWSLNQSQESGVVCPRFDPISGPGLLPSACHEIYIAISITYEFAVLF
jgi:hypothetical protein